MNPDVELLHRMVSIPSVSGSEQELAGFLVRAMRERGFVAAVDEAGNAVGELGDGPQEILLLGHMDTVPGSIPVQIHDGALYGRGAVDAKGPLAAFIAAVARVGPLPGKRLVVAGAVEEEAATSKGARHLLQTRRPDMVVIGEPSGWERITIAYKGRLLVEYRLEQPLAHTAGPQEGVCERAVAFWEALRAHASAYNQGRERRYERLDISLRGMRSGGDGLTEWAELTIAYRVPPALDLAEVRTAVGSLAQPEATVHCRGEELPYQAAKNTRLVAALLSGIRTVGGRPAFSFKTGTSDMNVVGPVWNCPIAAYGPGDSSLDHTPDEHIDLAEYELAIRVLLEALKAL